MVEQNFKLYRNDYTFGRGSSENSYKDFYFGEFLIDEISSKHLIADQLNFHFLDYLSLKLSSFKKENEIDPSVKLKSTPRITYYKNSHNDSLELVSVPRSLASKAAQNNHTKPNNVSVANLSTVGNVQESSSKPKAVIISAFMRSGSSLVGEVFNNHPDVFYSFEPLHGSVK